MPSHLRSGLFIVTPASFFLAATILSAQQKGFAQTPPMGWSSWNHFVGLVDATDLRAVADARVSSWMRDAGYAYINIDDTSESQRDVQDSFNRTTNYPI
jgi:alpha-galactosidase